MFLIKRKRCFLSFLCLEGICIRFWFHDGSRVCKSDMRTQSVFTVRHTCGVIFDARGTRYAMMQQSLPSTPSLWAAAATAAAVCVCVWWLVSTPRKARTGPVRARTNAEEQP